ncbi:MAG: hypothetical protein QM778_11545 [Myxococcales bacterium]
MRLFSPYARTLAIALLCACVLCLVMAARAMLEARSEGLAARRALARGDYPAAVAGFRRSARWNAPGNVFARDSLGSLEQLGEALEARGDLPDALSAQRAIHAAIHASQGFVTLEPERLRRADERIAALMVREPPAEIDAGRPEAERRALYLSLLKGRSPNSFWVVFAFAGCVTWVVAAAVFLLRGVDERGRVMRRIARRSGLMLLLGWIAFALGLRLA